MSWSEIWTLGLLLLGLVCLTGFVLCLAAMSKDPEWIRGDDVTGRGVK